jgi:uncharacterized protein (TIGR00255 family)
MRDASDVRHKKTMPLRPEITAVVPVDRGIMCRGDRYEKRGTDNLMASINSMTGFGHVEALLPGKEVQWEIRSVNHRYLEVQLKLPDGFRGFEQDFRQLIATYLRRGKVDAVLTIGKAPGQVPKTHLNEATAKHIIGHLETLSSEIKNPAPISTEMVLRWPGVLQEDEIDPEEALPAVKQALESATKALSESRAREGVKIEKMLEDRCIEINSAVVLIRDRLPDVLAGIRSRMEQRVETLNAKLDNDRLEQEILILSQKLDVSEELDRLQAHVEEVRTTVASGEPVGRRLDFLMQELNREANTLGSKSADADTTRQVVDLKVLIEQMREQVQNVE